MRVRGSLWPTAQAVGSAPHPASGIPLPAAHKL